jgi:hypothetical protein
MSEDRQQDSAWVRVATRLSPTELVAFCQDVERLLRINSMYVFEEWRNEGKSRYFMRACNLSNGQVIETAIRAEPRSKGMRIVYEAGLKAATELRIEPPGGLEDRADPSAGAVLVVVDDYSGTPEGERRARASEIDRSLVTWGHDLHRFLRHWARWSRFGPWRWYMCKVWQPMKPAARRITFVLVAITMFEVVVGALVVAVFAYDWR